MGGKRKPAQRTKNNVRPSSSGRSAELLTSSPSSFLDASGRSDNSILPLPSLLLPGLSPLNTPGFESNISSEYQVVVKKMKKKDSVTRHKALQEFVQLLEKSDMDEIKAILPIWSRLYSTLALDIDHKVRDVCQEAHRLIVNKAGRNIAPSLKQLIGPWFLSAFDSFPLAAQKAVLSFEEAFVPNKRTEALLFCHLEILSFIEENVIIHTPTTLSNPGSGCPMDEMVAKYERVVVASLNAYAQLLQKLPVDALTENQDVHKQKLVSSTAFWNYSKHKNPQIRRAWFGVIISLCQHAPYLLSDQVKQVCGIVFANLSDKNSTVLPMIWDAALELMVAFDDCWKHVNFNSVVVPKLWSVLRGGAYGNAVNIFPKLLPFLSKVPPPENEDWYRDFYLKFFSNLIAGFQERTVQQSAVEVKAVINALFECIQYVCKIQAKNTDLCVTLFRDQVFNLLESSLLDEAVKNNNGVVFSQLSYLLHHWQKQENVSVLYATIVDECWSHLTQVCRKPFASSSLDEWKLSNQLKLLKAMNQAFCGEPRNVKATNQSVGKQAKEETKIISPAISEEFFEKHLGKFISILIQQYYIATQNTTVENHLPKVYLCKIVTVFGSKQVLQYLLNCVEKENHNGFIALWDRLIKRWLKDDEIMLELVLHLCSVVWKHVEESAKTKILSEIKDDFGLSKFVQILYWVLCIDVTADSAAMILSWSKEENFQSALISISGNIDEDPEELEKKCVVLSKFLSSKEKESGLVTSTETFVKILHNLNSVLQQYVESAKISSRKVNALKQIVDLLATAFANTAVVYDLKVMEVVKESVLVIFKLCCMQNNSRIQQIFGALKSSWQCGLNVIFEFYPNCNSPELSHFSRKHAECIVNVLMSTETENVKNLSQLTVDYIVSNVTFVKSDDGEAASNIFCAHLCDLFVDTAINHSKTNLEEKIVSLSLFAELVNGKDDSIVDYNKLDKIIQKINSESPDVSDKISDSAPFSKNQFGLISREEVKSYANINVYIVSLILRFMDIPPAVELISVESLEDDSEDAIESTLPKNAFKVVTSVSYCAYSVEICKFFKSNFSNTVASYSLSKRILKYLEQNLQAIVSKLSNAEVQELVSKMSATRNSDNFVFCDAALQSICSKDGSKMTDSAEKEAALSNISSVMSVDVDTLRMVNKFLDQQLLNENRSEAEIILQQMNALIENKKLITFTYSVNMLDLTLSNIVLASNACKFLNLILKQSKFEAGNENRFTLLSEGETDFILISLTAWIQSLSKTVDCISLEPSYHCGIPIFINAICCLFETVTNIVGRLHSEDSFAAEWKDLFVMDVHVLVANAWRTLVQNSTNLAKSVQTYTIAKKLSDIIINVVDFGLIVKDDADLQKWSKFALSNLENSNIDVQLTSYYILIKLIPNYVAYDLKIVSEEETDEEIEKDPKIVFNWFKNSLDHTQSILGMMLSDFKFGDTCMVAPLTDSYSYTLAYLSLWSVIFEMVGQAESQLRYRYTLWIRNEYLISNLVPNLIRLLPASVVHNNMHDSNWKRVQESFAGEQTLSTNEQWDSNKLSSLVCWTYCNALRRLPALIRQWWTEVDYKEARVVEDVTARYVSAMLCEEELKAIREANKTPTENFTIKVRDSVREVIATYTLEEIEMEVSITLAQNHPLGMVRVESTKAAMSSQHWHNWLKQLTIFLTHQNGSIWDGLMSWKSNIDKRFEGVEECYICFSILHVTSYELPRKNCRTCHKKFHLHCLYKWFMTSNKSTCPICRNLF